MLLAQRLRELRESKNLSQGDIEKRTGYFAATRVENGYTVPSVETLETFAKALEVPLHQFFVDESHPTKKPQLRAGYGDEKLWGSIGKERNELRMFVKALSRMSERNRKLLLAVAGRMANPVGRTRN